MQKFVMSWLFVVSGLLMISFTLSAKAPQGRESFAEMVHNRYCSTEAIEDQLEHLKSPEEYQLVAAWLQLELLHASDEAFKKLASSQQWQKRTAGVTRLLKSLALDESGVALSTVYQRCFETLEPDNRIVPGFENEPRELIKPSTFARRAFKS